MEKDYVFSLGGWQQWMEQPFNPAEKNTSKHIPGSQMLRNAYATVVRAILLKLMGMGDEGWGFGDGGNGSRI